MLTLGFQYIRWHYSYAFVDLYGIICNFLWFFYEFFSISLLVRTFFVPFHRLEDDRKKRNALDFEVMGEALLVNTLMRLVGAFMRGVLILLGTAFMLVTLVFGGVMLLVWLLAPCMLAFLILAGLTLLAVG